MIDKILLLLLLPAVLAGCATSRSTFQPAQLSQLDLGTPKGDVLKILGPPNQCGTKIENRLAPTKIEDVQREVFQYAHKLPRRSATNFFLVFFEDGKVIAYGPQIGQLKERVIGVFLEEPPEQ